LRNKISGSAICRAVILNWSIAVKETDKQYYSRRGNEERSRARTAATDESRSIHDDLADLCHERANRSANVNGRKGIRPPARGRAEA
jgi:protein required for attachment to host cells